MLELGDFRLLDVDLVVDQSVGFLSQLHCRWLTLLFCAELVFRFHFVVIQSIFECLVAFLVCLP